MIQRFLKAIQIHQWQNKKIVLAVSGGVDSMVMAELFHQCKLTLVVAHFNYALRGQDSEEDQLLVEKWCRENNIAFYCRKFELNKNLAEEGGNLQEKARDLRYSWFEELRHSLGFDCIATAHHEEDSIETMLINLFKGTGIAGLHGILPIQNRLIRPMLDFSKQDILAFAQEHQIPWRFDQSNDTNHYLRNKLRNQILPLLAETIPNVSKNLKANIQRFQEVEILYIESIERYRKRLVEKRGKEWLIPILKLKKSSPLHTILYEILLPFGFLPGQTAEVIRLLDAESGKKVDSRSYHCIKDRNMLVISRKKERDSTFVLISTFLGKKSIQMDDFTLILEVKEGQNRSLLEKIKNASSKEAFIKLRDDDFPLCLRPWRQGDYFYPLGLNKKKKISKFLIDQKVPVHQRDRIWVLESKKRIVWVLGMRLDERFKVEETSASFFYLNIKETAV